MSNAVHYDKNDTGLIIYSIFDSYIRIGSVRNLHACDIAIIYILNS